MKFAELRYGDAMRAKAASAKWRIAHRNGSVRTLNARGFTLLEVMVAVTIMAMVLVTLLGLKNSSMQNVMLMQHMTTATMLAKRAMVETTTEAKPGQMLALEGTFPEEEFKDYTWKKVIDPTSIATIMEVHVIVLWKEGTRQESVELVSFE
ncbi:MAG TPA: type II secretion system minor pseudopilin GspI [Nitrospirota bacterium]|nr:type II secretion system minor pseudopilin GspI [Nitrospirota bacterium]